MSRERIRHDDDYDGPKRVYRPGAAYGSAKLAAATLRAASRDADQEEPAPRDAGSSGIA